MNRHPVVALWTRRIGVSMAVWAVLACPIFPAPCPGVAAAEMKIGFVNTAKLFDGYDKTKANDASLEKRGKQKEAELEARMNELKKLRQSLELLSNEAREAKTREIEEKADELQRFRASTARDLRRDRDRIAKGLGDEILKGVADYAKANGFALILDSRSLLFGQAAYDVTDEVLKVLNNRAAGKPAP